MKRIHRGAVLIFVDCLSSYVLADFVHGKLNSQHSADAFQRIMTRSHRIPGELQVRIRIQLSLFQIRKVQYSLRWTQAANSVRTNLVRLEKSRRARISNTVCLGGAFLALAKKEQIFISVARGIPSKAALAEIGVKSLKS